MFLYVAVGATLTVHRLDAVTGALDRGTSVELPAEVQYAWPHSSRRTLYVASSDGAPGLGRVGGAHHLSALGIDASGALTPRGAPVPLPARPIHVCADPASRHVLVAFNDPPAVRVYRLAPGETVAGEVEQPRPVELGVFPHQVRVTPDGRRVVVACRGFDARAGRPERPGSLRVFRYDDGRLGEGRVIAPGGGYGFGPRHVDFHPERPWLYASLERQNQLAMFAFGAEGELEEAPRHRLPTLAGPSPARQLAGAVHVHPRGHVAYVANRAPEIAGPGDVPESAAGDNTIAVYALDPDSGEPRPLQHVDTAGIHCRTFQIDPGGTLLVAAHITGGPSRPAGLSLFRIAPDGRLTLVRREEVDAGQRLLFWTGIVERISGGEHA